MPETNPLPPCLSHLEALRTPLTPREPTSPSTAAVDAVGEVLYPNWHASSPGSRECLMPMIREAIEAADHARGFSVRDGFLEWRGVRVDPPSATVLRLAPPPEPASTWVLWLDTLRPIMWTGPDAAEKAKASFDDYRKHHAVRLLRQVECSKPTVTA